ncbi:hypothetical protein EYF80_059787 [Liparis tanakae]|uniref:Uncharacterized protein n=1 Tax=Liparis tanakae TaxID=230148 RepID=A0A4Z2ENA9_9TELE|nr:hypothetical protein EYF80_059787 [Liparis tanakae]
MAARLPHFSRDGEENQQSAVPPLPRRNQDGRLLRRPFCLAPMDASSVLSWSVHLPSESPTGDLKNRKTPEMRIGFIVRDV